MWERKGGGGSFELKSKMNSFLSIGNFDRILDIYFYLVLSNAAFMSHPSQIDVKFLIHPLIHTIAIAIITRQ